MRDDFLTRDWADNRHRLHFSVHKLIETVSVSLARLNAYQFDAPWRTDAVRRPTR